MSVPKRKLDVRDKDGDGPFDGEAAAAPALKSATSSSQIRPTRMLRVLGFFALFIPYCAVLSWFSITEHYKLPVPLASLNDPATGLPQFSEEQALGYISHYAEKIGYRIVGTPEMDETLDYTLNILDRIKKQLPENAAIQMEIDHQKGDGQHLFHFMHKVVWKKYLGISNIVVRLSNGTEASKADAILINAHLDSTLPSPGAADDGAGVAVMLEAIRVLSHESNTKLNHAIIFLFNGAEESLQDASHLFITQHPWRHTIRAAINLEACGVAGKEMLFQATSKEMIKAYSVTPSPMGSVLATEVFMTGLIGSDTDFRQFVQYGNLTGLDMALISDSYKYHTRLDIVKNIQSGAMQHFGNNILAILRYLAATPTSQELRAIKPSRDTMFFSAFGSRVFIMLSKSTTTMIYAVAWVIVLMYTLRGIRRDRWHGYLVAALSIPVSVIMAVVFANGVAALMVYGLDKPFRYYRQEWYALALYGIPALLGIAVTQLCATHLGQELGLVRENEDLQQHAVLVGYLLYTSTVTLFAHTLGVLSAYIVALAMLSTLVALLINDFVLIRGRHSAARRSISAFFYPLGQLMPLLLGAEGLITFLETIIPLTGRMGVSAPSDNIAASLVAAMLPLVLPTFPALLHRWGKAMLLRFVVLLLLLSSIVIAIFAAPSWQPFDATHPKRVCVLYMENTTSQTLDLHVAGLDATTTILSDILKDAAAELQLSSPPVSSKIDDDIPDWDIIYPVSQFLHSYKIPLDPLPPDYVSPYKHNFKIKLVESRLNAIRETRFVRIRLEHPGIIWTVMAFHAEVIEWDLPEAPGPGRFRHHIKEVSAHGVDSWELSMTIQLQTEQFQAALRQSQRRKGQRPRGGKEEDDDAKLGGLKIDFSGLDASRMWHSSQHPGMQFLRRLDAALPDYVDSMLLTAVASQIYI